MTFLNHAACRKRMPKFIAHGLMGATIIAALHPRPFVNRWAPMLLGAALAISPDLDHLPEWILGITNFHRGMTHSIIFSGLVALALAFLFRMRDWWSVAAFALAYASHAFADAFFSTEGGVQLLWPLSDEYYGFGLTDILELPFGHSIDEVLRWVFLEVIIFLPVFLIAVAVRRFGMPIFLSREPR